MRLLLTLSFLLLSACATTPDQFNEIQIGMSKKEAIELLGPPRSTSAKENLEYMSYTYNLGPISGLPAPGGPEEYYIRLIDGKVESYGRKGDFDSTKDRPSKININVSDE